MKIPSPSFGPKPRTKSWPASLVTRSARPPLTYDTNHWDRRLALVAFHLHLLEDLVGSRGPDGFNWPIPYLFPFSTRCIWTWGGQWKLHAWPTMPLTMALLL